MATKIAAAAALMALLLIVLPATEAQIGGGGFPLTSGWPIVPASAVTDIIEALRTQGFSLAGLALKGLGNFIPAYTTLMIPTNEAIADYISLNQTSVPSLLLYHAVAQVLPFQMLEQFPVGQQLPTLLFGNELVVNDNSEENYVINNARITRKNLCGTNSLVISCHGIDRVLDPASLATNGGGTRAPASAPFPARGPSGLIPPRMTPPPTPQIITIPGPAIAPGASPVAVTTGPSTPNGARLLQASYSILLLLLTLFFNSIIL